MSIKINRYFFSAIFLFLALYIASGVTAHAEATPERTKIYLSIGDTFTIETDKTLGSDDFLNANWYSSDESVLDIIGDNYNRASCKIKALSSSVGKTVTVRVDFQYVGVFPEVPGVYDNTYLYYFVVTGEDPQSISLIDTVQITDTEKITLTPQILPEDSEKACNWSSSNESVATVNSSGVVSGVSKGTAVISAKTINGLTASCTVNVRSSQICGDNLEWDFKDGTLTISGSGDMYDYSYDAPWSKYNEEITRIIINDGVTGIGSFAFAETAVSEIALPESLVSIRDEAFCWCENLDSIYIPSGVSSLTGDPFSNRYFRSITVSPENDIFCSFDGILFSKDMTILIRYPSGRIGSTYSIPEHVDSIAFAAFYDTLLTDLYVPDTVYDIEYYGISTIGLNVHGTPGSAAEKAVNDYNAVDDTMNFINSDSSSSMMISIGNVYGKYGDTVRVPVNVSNCKGFSNLNIQISYDSHSLDLISAASAETSAMFTNGPYTGTGSHNMSWDSAKNVSFNGTIATLEFKINDPYFSGRTPIGVTFYTGLNGNYTDGVDVNYDQGYFPLGLIYTSGSIAEPRFSNKIIIDSITPGSELSFRAELTSVEELKGTVCAAVYDKSGALIGLQLFNASKSIDLSFSCSEKPSRISVMWFDSINSLKPYAKSAEAYI